MFRFPFACLYIKYMLRKLSGKYSLRSLEGEALKEIVKEMLFFSFLCLY